MITENASSEVCQDHVDHGKLHGTDGWELQL